MITDPQVRKLRLEQQGTGKERAALKGGMDPKTARKYRRLGKLPSEVKRTDRNWRTRTDSFAEVWPDILDLLRLNPELEAKTLFADLQRRFPGRFAAGQLRTLQRRCQRWRAPPRRSSSPRSTTLVLVCQRLHPLHQVGCHQQQLVRRSGKVIVLWRKRNAEFLCGSPGGFLEEVVEKAITIISPEEDDAP